jgi:hypothetical protein
MSAREAREGRLVDAALCCYPARWRRRHADEAAELAGLLIKDGIPATSITWSYLSRCISAGLWLPSVRSSGVADAQFRQGCA